MFEIIIDAAFASLVTFVIFLRPVVASSPPLSDDYFGGRASSNFSLVTYNIPQLARIQQNLLI